MPPSPAAPAAGGAKRPPRARLAFRVGVVGHRPDRLGAADVGALARVINDVLAAVRDVVLEVGRSPESASLYATGEPLLTAVSPLAEGTDRIFAEQALACGYALCAPLPFSREEYAQDFAGAEAHEPDSIARFDEILRRAREGAGLVTFELPGDRERAGAAYGQAGRVVLNQSDVLVVVWDGRPAKGGGGTVETFREARQFGLPVVWIDAAAPHEWQLALGDEAFEDAPEVGAKRPRADGASLDRLRTVVAAQLRLPPVPAGPDPEEGTGSLALDYLNERQRRWNLFPVWKLFRNLVGSGSLRAQSLRIQPYAEHAWEEWPARRDAASTTTGASARASSSEMLSWVNDRLRLPYVWADRLADVYADAYRSTYVLAYLSAAIAVALALVPVAMHWTHDNPRTALVVLGEVLIVILVILLVRWARRRQWHEKWLEYRLLAESIRQLRVLIPLGGGRPRPQVMPQLESYGDPTRLWTQWLTSAISREIGIPSVKVDAEYVRGCLAHLEDILGRVESVRSHDARTASSSRITGGQYAFHTENSRRSHRIQHRLHHFALALLWFTILAGVLHLVPSVVQQGALVELAERYGGWLTFASAALPAFGAALASIENQGEFARIAKRSHAMAHRMERYLHEVGRLRQRLEEGRPLDLIARDLTTLSTEIAQLMVDEVADWRVVFTDRPEKEPA